VPELPKTRSGKIVRRLLREFAEGRELGDTSTLVDPSVFEAIRATNRPGGRTKPALAHPHTLPNI
jgi:acetyl-CoA synthetase